MRTDRRMETIRGRKSSFGARCGLLTVIALFLPGLLCAQVIRYAAPVGAGSEDGSDWANAYSATNLQAAVDAAIAGGGGSIVYLQEGMYALTNQLEIAAAAGLTLSGGWAGNDTGGLPGTQGTQETVLTRDESVAAMRIIHAVGSTLTIRRVAITEGASTTSGFHGTGLFLQDGSTVIENSRVSGQAARGHGVGIYALNGSLTLTGCEISDNNGDNPFSYHGGGLYADNVNLVISNTVFVDNRSGGNWTVKGGALYVSGGEAWIDNTEFRNNHVGRGTGAGAKYGGVIAAEGVNPLVITNCLIEGGSANSGNPIRGGAVYIEGAGATTIVDSRVHRNAYAAMVDDFLAGRNVVDVSGDDLYLDVSGSVTLRNTEIMGGMLRGIYKTGSGDLTLENCLLALQSSHGIEVDQGAVTIRNSTIAGNGGWGVLTSLDITVTDSIVWDNHDGGLSVGGDSTITYSCIQEDHAGTGNFSENPRFVAGYYLERDGLPFQAEDSPCLGQGSADAGTLGLDAFTTRTDGAAASGTVDLGYHYATGVSVIEALALYVDAVDGLDTNTGFTSGEALRTISAALDKAIDGSVIHIAPGTYNEAGGETFPLRPTNFNITLLGTDPQTTIIQGNDTDRVLSLAGLGNTALEGVTITMGRARTGGAMVLLGSHIMIQNCLIHENSIVSGYGAIYANGGSLRLYDSTVSTNLDVTAGTGGGGGMHLDRIRLHMKGSTLAGNRVFGNHDGWGGGIYIRQSSGLIEDSVFTDNYASGGGGSQRRWGGAIYLVADASLTISNCFFSGNYADGSGRRGGAINLNSGQSLVIVDSVFSNNYNVLSTHDIEVTAGSLMMDRTIIAGGSDSGIYSSGGTSVGITNTLIHSQPGDGIRIAAGSASIASTTLADNDGWGLVFDGTDLAVENMIAWGNTAGGVSNNASGTATIIHTASQETHGDPADNNLAGEDPLFEDAGAGDYRLQRASPGLDAGINRAWMADATDLAGMQRILPGAGGNYTVDMGAYETRPPSGSMFMFR